MAGSSHTDLNRIVSYGGVGGMVFIQALNITRDGGNAWYVQLWGDNVLFCMTCMICK